MHMEIERKFLIKKEQLPKDLANCSFHKIEQGYLCTDPVVRIRRQDDEYYLTYKSKGLLSREEYNLPLTQESYEHLKPKADGIVISKTRYLIPEKDGLTVPSIPLMVEERSREKDSKICAWNSSDIPIPLSAIEISM